MRVGVVAGRAHLLFDDRALDIEAASNGRLPSDPMMLYNVWDELRSWASSARPDDAVAITADELQNPLPAPRQVFAIGANYRDHADEAGASLPAYPLVFTKFPTCLTGPQDPIPVPTPRVDWEVELVVVMGRMASGVDAADAWDYVAGLTVGQDISERAIQLSGKNPQFSMGKSFPNFGPLGPSVVSVDELADPDDLEIGCSLNGEVMQHSRTSQLVFSVGELIAYISRICPLLPGDVIFTGTPSGVGAFREPRIFLRPGDVLTSWVEGIGTIENPIVAAPPLKRGRR